MHSARRQPGLWFVAALLGWLTGCEAGVSPSPRERTAEARRMALMEERLHAIERAGSPGGSDRASSEVNEAVADLRQALDAIETRLNAIEQRLARGGSSQGAGRTAVPWQPDRRPGLLFDCAGDPVTNANPFGLIEDQWRSAAASRDFFRRRYEQADRFYQQAGFVRIIWRRTGGQRSGDAPAGLAGLASLDGRQWIDGAWVDKHPWRRRIFLDETARFINDHPGATVGISMGALLPASWQSIDPAAAMPLTPFDPRDARHRRLAIDQIARPLAASGIHELWLEYADQPGHRESALALAQVIRESVPLHVVVIGPDSAGVAAADANELKRSPLAFDAASLTLPAEWAAPDGAELIVLAADAAPRTVAEWLGRGLIPFAGDETSQLALLAALGG